MNTLLLTNTGILLLVAITCITGGINTITKLWGIGFLVIAVINFISYLQIVFPNINWI